MAGEQLLTNEPDDCVKSQKFIDKINAFFCMLRRNSRWPTKMAGKRFLAKIVEISISHTILDINAFLHYTQKFKMVTKKKREGKQFLAKCAI